MVPAIPSGRVQSGGTRSGSVLNNADFTLVPFCQQLRRGKATDQSGMNHAREADARNMARCRVDAVEVPAGLARVWEMLVEEPTAVLVGEDASEAPLRIFEPTDVVDVDDQQVAGLGTLDPERTAQVVHLGQVDVPDVVRGIVVLDLPAGPVIAFDAKLVAWLEPSNDRDVGMPAVVSLYGLIFRPLIHLSFEHGSWHDASPPLLVLILVPPFRARERRITSNSCEKPNGRLNTHSQLTRANVSGVIRAPGVM